MTQQPLRWRNPKVRNENKTAHPYRISQFTKHAFTQSALLLITGAFAANRAKSRNRMRKELMALLLI